MERFLVTGGAGFIGAHLVARLVERAEVVVVDDMSWGDASKLTRLQGVKVIREDVRRLKDRGGELGRFSHVFQLAALISAYQSLENPDEYFETNVGGLLGVMETCGSVEQPPRLVFASTSGVYGNSELALKSEGDLPRPTTVYAVTKLAGEQLLSMYRDRLGFDDVALRFFNVYGPGQSPNHPYANVTCRFSHAAAQGRPIQLYGDGRQTRDFIYIDDVIEAILTVAFRPTRERVYNVGTGRSASIAQLLSTVQGLAGAPVSVERLAPWPNDIQDICADVSRLETELGFRARVDLETGLARTIASFRSPP